MAITARPRHHRTRSSTATAAANTPRTSSPVSAPTTDPGQRRADRGVLGQRRRRIVLRHLEERDVPPAAVRHPGRRHGSPSPNTSRSSTTGKRLHSSLGYRTPAEALTDHQARSSGLTTTTARNCPRSLTQPTSRYQGTVRVDRSASDAGSSGIIVSGDLYRRPWHAAAEPDGPVTREDAAATGTAAGAVGSPGPLSIAAAASTPGASVRTHGHRPRIPVYPRAQYHSYLKVVSVSVPDAADRSGATSTSPWSSTSTRNLLPARSRARSRRRRTEL